MFKKTDKTMYFAVATILLLIVGGISFFTFVPKWKVNSSASQSTNTKLNVAEPYKAEEIRGIESWINSNGETLEALKGKVVLIDFWTYSCINCIRTLPYVSTWYEKYKDDGFIVLGLHAPEFAFERKRENVQNAVNEHKIKYPIALDNSFETWRAYNNQYWPAHYFIDKEGRVRHTHFGEGQYDVSEQVIQTLLSEGSEAVDKLITKPSVTTELNRNQSPETYLGYTRGERFLNVKEFKEDLEVDYELAPKLELDTWSLGGNWIIKDEKSISGSNDSILKYKFTAKEVYLVMGSEELETVSVKVNGKTVDQGKFNIAGEDVSNSSIMVKEFRLYKILKSENLLREAELELQFSKGIEVHAFTFGS